MARWIVAFALLIAAGAAPAFADPAADRAAIVQRFKDWTAAFNRKDMAGVCDLFAPDLVYSTAEIVNASRDTLCGHLEKLLSAQGLRLEYAEPDIHEILIDGDTAVVRLTWTLTAEAGGKRGATKEEGIDILRRQPDGRWAIARFIAFSTEEGAGPR